MPQAPDPHSVGKPRGLGRHRLGPHVVGARVVIRHLLPDGRATDVLGVCTAWGEDVVVVESDRGPVEVRVADIVTGKPVPPRPSVRHRVTALEAGRRVAALFADMESEPLGEWTLRAAPPHEGRLLKRANSALAMGDPGVPLAEAAARVVEFYAARQRPALAQVEQDGDVASGLLGLGWRSLGHGSAHVQLAPVSRALRACRATDAPLDDDSRGVPVVIRSTDGDQLEVVTGDGAARGWAVLDGDWLGLHSLWVDPDRRRRGLGRLVLAELLDWGASRGATTAWLHVETDNPGAVALYEGAGFTTHHTVGYLTRD